MNRRHFLTATAALSAPVILGRTPPPRLRIGQIGLAHPHAAGKLQAIQQLKDTYELVGVVEPDAALRRRAQGVKFVTLEELMNTPALAAVAIETRVRDLVTTALPVVEAGQHIHLDKPAGPELAPFRKLLATAEQKKLCVQMGYMLRYNPAFQFLFKVVRDGWLGEVTEVSGMMGKYMGDAGRRDLARFEGGGMFELACHLIDALVTVLGAPSSVRSITHRTFPAKDSFADNQLAVFDYPKAIATIVVVAPEAFDARMAIAPPPTRT